jgi:hypothetical protein
LVDNIKVTKGRDDQRTSRIAAIDDQIAQLKAQIDKLNLDRDGVVQDGLADKKTIEESDQKVSDFKIKIDAAKLNV